MRLGKRGWLLAGLMFLAIWPVAVPGQESLWKKYNVQGSEAFQQARYAKAKKLYLAALQEAEKFGEQDPRLAISLNNLAALYDTRGKYVRAELLYRRALAIREKVLGPEHLDVATSLNNLAALYLGQGKYAEAEPLYQRALAIKEKTLGPEDPEVALILGNYATLLRVLNRRAEAKKMKARAKAIRAKHVQEKPPR